MSKHYILIILFFVSRFSLLFSYDDLTTNLIINFSNEIITNEKYKPDITRLIGGKGYKLTFYNEIQFHERNIPFTIYQRIAIDQVPYNEDSIEILKSLFNDDLRNKQSELFSSNTVFYRDRKSYFSFEHLYKPQDIDQIPNYQSDILYGADGTLIERDFAKASWPINGPEDRLTYYFQSDQGLYSEYIIEFYGIWAAFRDYHDKPLMEPKLTDFKPPEGGEEIIYLYTMTNEELAAYPDQNDPSIRLMHLLNEAMETFRFKERPNAPPANLAVVNDLRVRLRSGYSLDDEVLGHVNTGEEVIVMERSPERETIGGETDYWYKVVSRSSYLKGWMFGCFLEFEER